ncbi:MAG TPA: Rnf-Nqr domain containing protein [Gammaproteobacteria bacterium]|nr:Rnf-Nqr domain containing protein [Gammaproteobacteria bacterium]
MSHAAYGFWTMALAGNLALEYQLGICPLLAMSRRYEVAQGMAVVTLVVVPLLAIIGYAVQVEVLVPLNLTAWQLPLWVLVFFLALHGLELAAQRLRPGLHEQYAVFLPMFRVNCLVLGAALLAVDKFDGFFAAVLGGLGMAAGYALVLLMLAAVRERLALAETPAAFRGAPITVITLGLMSLGWQGLKGIF